MDARGIASSRPCYRRQFRAGKPPAKRQALAERVRIRVRDPEDEDGGGHNRAKAPQVVLVGRCPRR
jgi:hypothetical protein